MTAKLTMLPGARHRTPDDLPDILRELADAAERGEVQGMVFACERDGEYTTHQAASLHDSLVLATLLQANTLDKFREA